MLKLIIEDDEGRKTVVPFVREEITIGRQEGNTIRLTERNVSRRHARLVRQNGHVLVEDLGSYNGTRINGERIQGQSPVQDGDLIQIGDYDLALQEEGITPPPPSSRPPPAEPNGRSGDDEASADGADTAARTLDDEAPTPLPIPGPRRQSTAIIRMEQVEVGRPRKVESVDADEAPRLVVLTSEFKGQEFACVRTELRIGRTEDNDISLDHRSLSRTHAKLVREDNGEWRILDMQSANGLTVNGESYAQAALASGDIIELGHVKLRFVAAGDSFAALATDGDARSKLPLVLTLLLVLGVASAGAIYFLSTPSSDPTLPPPPETAEAPASSAQPPPPEPPPEAQPTEPSPGQTAPPPTESAATAALEQKLQEAQAALNEGNVDKAVAVLEALQGPGNARPRNVESLLDRAKGEQLMRKHLADAEKALKAQQLDEARQLLAASAGTTVFARKHAELVAALENAKSSVSPSTSPDGKLRPLPPRPSPEVVREQAETAYKDAVQLLRQKQFNEAWNMFNKCLELEPNNPDCLVMLGATYAGLRQPDKAAETYRKFLSIAPPGHPRIPKVREIVNDYDKSKTHP